MFKENFKCRKCKKDVLYARRENGGSLLFDLGLIVYRVISQLNEDKSWGHLVKQQKPNCFPLHICLDQKVSNQTYLDPT